MRLRLRERFTEWARKQIVGDALEFLRSEQVDLSNELHEANAENVRLRVAVSNLGAALQDVKRHTNNALHEYKLDTSPRLHALAANVAALTSCVKSINEILSTVPRHQAKNSEAPIAPLMAVDNANQPK